MKRYGIGTLLAFIAFAGLLGCSLAWVVMEVLRG